MLNQRFPLRMAVCLLMLAMTFFTGPHSSQAKVQDETPTPNETSDDVQPKRTSEGSETQEVKPETAVVDDTEKQDAEEVMGVDLDAIDGFARQMLGARKYSRISPDVVTIVEPVIASISPSTVRVYSGKKQLAIGTIVDPSGLILTIADELKSPIQCKLPDGSTQTAVVFGVDPETGLALLKVQAENLHSINLTEMAVANVGDWLASAAPDRKPISIGVVSVLERKITQSAFIGIQMEDEERGVRITSVVPKSPADKADLFINDVIVRINSTPIKDRVQLQQQMQNYSPGDEIEMVVLRQSKEKVFRIVLAPRGRFEEQNNQQERMGSVLSARRQGFALAFQHDSFLQANECGSPVVNLDGRIAGINVSRSGRVSTLALPVNVVIPAIERLKSGNLNPTLVNAKRIDQIRNELKTLDEEARVLPENLEKAKLLGAQADARIEEIKNSLQALQNRMDELEKERKSFIEEAKSLELQVREADVRRLRLDRELKELTTGAR